MYVSPPTLAGTLMRDASRRAQRRALAFLLAAAGTLLGLTRFTAWGATEEGTWALFAFGLACGALAAWADRVSGLLIVLSQPVSLMLFLADQAADGRWDEQGPWTFRVGDVGDGPCTVDPAWRLRTCPDLTLRFPEDADRWRLYQRVELVYAHLRVLVAGPPAHAYAGPLPTAAEAFDPAGLSPVAFTVAGRRRAVGDRPCTADRATPIEITITSPGRDAVPADTPILADEWAEPWRGSRSLATRTVGTAQHPGSLLVWDDGAAADLYDRCTGQLVARWDRPEIQRPVRPGNASERNSIWGVAFESCRLGSAELDRTWLAPPGRAAADADALRGRLYAHNLSTVYPDARGGLDAAALATFVHAAREAPHSGYPPTPPLRVLPRIGADATHPARPDLPAWAAARVAEAHTALRGGASGLLLDLGDVPEAAPGLDDLLLTLRAILQPTAELGVRVPVLRDGHDAPGWSTAGLRRVCELADLVVVPIGPPGDGRLADRARFDFLSAALALAPLSARDPESAARTSDGWGCTWQIEVPSATVALDAALDGLIEGWPLATEGAEAPAGFAGLTIASAEALDADGLAALVVRWGRNAPGDLTPLTAPPDPPPPAAPG